MNTFDYFVFVGTYTKPMWLETHETSEGIYTLEYNSSTGELKQKSSIKNHNNPSFLAIHPNKKFLYSMMKKSIILSKIIFVYVAVLITIISLTYMALFDPI